MSFLTADKTKVSGADWTRIQTCWFPILESGVITKISEVTEQSIANYLDDKYINGVVKDAEKAIPPSYTPIAFT